MKVVVAGGSGFIGTPLVRGLLARGDEVAVLSRNPAKVKAGRGVAWDARSQGPWSNDAASADVVINLTGESIGEGRWTRARKRLLVDSRIDSTRALVEAMRAAPARKRTFVNASAVGYYGDRDEETLDENATRGEGFLADLVERWEGEAHRADDIARVILPRFGVVFGSGGGVLARMTLPFRFGAGGPVGSGRQWTAWVDQDDLIRFITWLVDQPAARGVYNATSPQPARNRDVANAIGRVLHRPSLMPAPSFALRIALGQMADELLLVSQRVVPTRAVRERFAFQRPDVESSLRAALTKP
jgi:uncharacterized protein (TIGR01777 family)